MKTLQAMNAVIDAADALCNFVRVDRTDPDAPVYTLEDTTEAAECLRVLDAAMVALERQKEKMTK